jgi:anti-sigma regulatory factor (Ser/Thr protein kinase)
VVVRCFEDDRRFEVRVDDFGRGFDPAALPGDVVIRDAHLHRERGIGIPLIRAMVDEAEFRSSSDGTSVRMVLRCRPAGAQTGADNVEAGADGAAAEGARA